MNVGHKVFIDNPEIEAAVRKDITLNIAFTTLENFIKQRLALLKDEIDKEESLSPNNMPCTIIRLYNDDIQPKGILFVGYSKELRDRMKASFGSNDFNFISQQIENMISAINN